MPFDYIEGPPKYIIPGNCLILYSRVAIFTSSFNILPSHGRLGQAHNVCDRSPGCLEALQHNAEDFPHFSHYEFWSISFWPSSQTPSNLGFCWFMWVYNFIKSFFFSGRLKALRSGPSSMIELEQFEENDDMSMLLNIKHIIYT